MEYFRETAFGQVARLVAGNKILQLQYEEERNPELWRTYINEAKSANAARYGQVEPPEKEDAGRRSVSDTESQVVETGSFRDSSTTIVSEGHEYNDVTGLIVDPEKGKNVNVVDFLPNDPEVGYMEQIVWFQSY